MFHMGTYDQIMEGRGIWRDRGRGGREKLSTGRGLNLKNTFCTLFLWCWRFHWKPAFFFQKILVVTCSLMSWALRFAYLWARIMEKWVKVLHSESEGSCLKPRLFVTFGSYEHQTQWLTLGYWVNEAAPRHWSEVICGAVNSLVIRFSSGM